MEVPEKIDSVSRRINIKLRRTVVISLVLFSIFITAGELLLFRSSLKRDAEHVKLVSLTGDAESGILRSRIWVDEIILHSDHHLMPELTESLDILGNTLRELGDFLENEYSRYRGSDYQVFREKFELVIRDYNYLKEQIHNDPHGKLAVSDTNLFNTINGFNLTFRDFRSFIPTYLMLDKREYRNEIVFVTLLNALIIILAGYAILRLTNQLAEAERRLVMSTIEVENRERERIAADLHDGLGALLSGLMIHIQVLQKEEGEKGELQRKLKHLGDLASGTLTGLEETINNLNPSMLVSHGLAGSLQRLITRINDLGKTKFGLKTENMTDRLDQGTELLLFRICSELINNTLKHSGAKSAVLQLSALRKSLRLKYMDDGCGFEYDLEKIEERKSGINNIMQRVESMNGQFKISTAPGEGIEVMITLPLVKV